MRLSHNTRGQVRIASAVLLVGVAVCLLGIALFGSFGSGPQSAAIQSTPDANLDLELVGDELYLVHDGGDPIDGSRTTLAGVVESDETAVADHGTFVSGDRIPIEHTEQTITVTWFDGEQSHTLAALSVPERDTPEDPEPQLRTGTIVGTVTYGDPIENATIEIVEVSNPQVSVDELDQTKVLTDENGTYRFEDVPVGAVTVSADERRFKRVEQTDTVDETQETRIDFRFTLDVPSEDELGSFDSIGGVEDIDGGGGGDDGGSGGDGDDGDGGGDGDGTTETLESDFILGYEDYPDSRADWDYNDWVVRMGLEVDTAGIQGNTYAEELRLQLDPQARFAGLNHDQYVVPAGLSEGTYSLTVRNGDGSVIRSESGEYDAGDQLYVMNSEQAFPQRGECDPERTAELVFRPDEPVELDGGLPGPRTSLHGEGLPINPVIEPSGSVARIGSGDVRTITTDTDWRWPTGKPHIADAYDFVDRAADGSPAFTADDWFDHPIQDDYRDPCNDDSGDGGAGDVTAKISTANPDPRVGETVFFAANRSSSENGDIETVTWDATPGGRLTDYPIDEAVSLTRDQPMDVVVTLTVTDETGATDTTSTTITFRPIDDG